MNFDENNLFIDIPDYVKNPLGIDGTDKIQIGCAPDAIKQNGTCYSDSSIAKMKSVVPEKKYADATEVVNAVDIKFGCKTDPECITKNGGLDLNLLNTDFVPKGPINGEWLSNFDIIACFDMWARIHKHFIYIEPQMNDFERHNKELSQVDWKKFKNDPEHKIIGCVINTDNYGNRGQHWVAIVSDNKDKTIEYFDSAGGAPSNEIMRFVEKVSAITGFRVVYCNQVKHQQENSECGVYCIYYILCRLHNVKPEYFLNPNKRLHDKLMRVFRVWIYRP
jgi:hypothetical protein